MTESRALLLYICGSIGVPDIDRCNAASLADFETHAFETRRCDSEYRWQTSVPIRFEWHRRNGSWLSLLMQICSLLWGRQRALVIVYGYQIPLCFLVAIVARLLGKRVVSQNDSKFDDYVRSLWRDIGKIALLLPYSYFFCATERALQYLAYLGFRNSSVYYCAIDTGRFRSSSEPGRADLASKPFVAIARFIEKKNLVELVRAYAMYKAASVSPRGLEIYGYGPLECELRSEIDRCRLGGWVEVKGFVSSDDLPQVLARCSVLLLISKSEQFGIVVTEALSAGLPVIVGAECGAAELVRPLENGLIVKSADSYSAAEAMLFFDRPGELTRMGQNAAKSAAIADVIRYVDLVGRLIPDRKRARVALCYDFFPHYRAGFIKAVEATPEIFVTYYGDRVGIGGIAEFPFLSERFVSARVYRVGKLAFQPRVVLAAMLGRADAYVFLANPNHISTWIAALICRIRRKRVIFWGHGFTSGGDDVRNLLRRAFFRLANAFYLYGARAKAIAIQKGFDARSLYVGFNSLDYDKQIGFRRKLLAGLMTDPWLGRSGESVRVMCVSRLTFRADYQLLIRAASLAADRGARVDIVFVGEGEARSALDSLATDLGVSVQFIGEAYDEALIAPYLYYADFTASPGKVGLTAMHSLMYGTPVVTHDDPETQMPEAEAVINGRTGALFKRGDVEDLVRCLLEVPRGTKREAVRHCCFSVVDRFYNPRSQVSVFIDAVSGVDAATKEDVMENFLLDAGHA